MYSSDLSNAELLLSYGFTIPDNENDTVMVDIEPPDEAWRTRLLPFTPQHYLTRKAPLPLQLQHAVALACCSKIELKNRLKEGVWAVAVQRRALQLLLEMLQVRAHLLLKGLWSLITCSSRSGKTSAAASTAFQQATWSAIAFSAYFISLSI
jgi:hypothetical protein